jgi:hypothetical protein
MTRTILTFVSIIFLGCYSQDDQCKGVVLNLEEEVFAKNLGDLEKYTDDNAYKEITDSMQLLRYMNPVKESIFFREIQDTAKKKLKVKEGVIKELNYQLDVIYLPGKFSHFWLKTYDSNRKQIGSFHFAGASKDSVYYTGRIDCDTLIYQNIFKSNKSSVHRINKNGKFILVSKGEINK